jgi:hypothetical protein
MPYGNGRWGDQQQPVIRTDGDRTTPGGIWVYRDKDIHRCPKPSYTQGVKTGDIWECNECHKQWKVTVNSDQREGTWLTWTEHHGSTGIVPR